MGLVDGELKIGEVVGTLLVGACEGARDGDSDGLMIGDLDGLDEMGEYDGPACG